MHVDALKSLYQSVAVQSHYAVLNSAKRFYHSQLMSSLYYFWTSLVINVVVF